MVSMMTIGVLELIRTLRRSRGSGMILEVRLLRILHPVSTDRLYCPQQAFRSGKKEIVAAFATVPSQLKIRSGQDLHGSGSHLLIDAEPQVFMRVHWSIEDSYFIVKVRTG